MPPTKAEALLAEQSLAFTISMKAEIQSLKTELKVEFKDLLDAKIKPIQEAIEVNKSDIFLMKQEIKTLKEDFLFIKEELDQCKSKKARSQIYNSLCFNYYEQRLRAYSCKLHNFPVSVDKDDVMKSLSQLRNVYNTLIVPILSLAVENKRIAAVPSFVNCIDIGHYLSKHKMTYAEATATAGDLPPTTENEDQEPPEDDSRKPSFILRFVSRTIRDLFMTFKKDIVTDFNKNGAGLRIGDDLTQGNRANMSYLYDHKEVSKTRMRNSRVQFLLNGEEKWRMVMNPLTSDLKLMQKAVADPCPISAIYPKKLSA